MKVLLVATVQSHICQFHKPLVKMLHAHGAEVHIAARNNLQEKNGLRLDFADKVFDLPFSRSPKSKDNITAYKQLKKIINDEQYDVVHCNTPMGGIVGRLASKKARKNGTKVIYTAHGFHFYKGAPKSGWLIYYPIEKRFARRYTDKLILVNQDDYELAQKKKFCKNTYRIHSVGVSSEKYHPFSEQDKMIKREAFNYNQEDFICLCAGELNQNKNQSAIIKAVPEILKETPNFKLLLAGNGPKEKELRELIKQLGVEEQVILLGYVTNLPEYICASDLSVSVSIREGLGINLIEAMASNRPVIGSNNRGHKEFIKNGENGYLIDLNDIGVQFKNCVKELYFDKDNYQRLAIAGCQTAQIFLDTNVEKELENIYFGE